MSQCINRGIKNPAEAGKGGSREMKSTEESITHAERWRKPKRQARDIKHRKNKRLAVRHLLRMIKDALN